MLRREGKMFSKRDVTILTNKMLP